MPESIEGGLLYFNLCRIFRPDKIGGVHLKQAVLYDDLSCLSGFWRYILFDDIMRIVGYGVSRGEVAVMGNGINIGDRTVVTGEVPVHDAVLIAQVAKIVLSIGLRLTFVNIRGFGKMLQLLNRHRLIIASENLYNLSLLYLR